MSAGKHKSRCGGRRVSMTELEKVERFMFVLSREVSRACDEYQLRTNGYKPNGLRGIINASVLKTQSENK